MTSKIKIILVALFLTVSAEAKAQVCTGALGDPIAGTGTDFGSGQATYAPALPASRISYQYVAGVPNDGQYTLIKNTNGQNSGWHQNVFNHTPNDPNGYMMLVNADFNQGIFYQAPVPQLCPNVTYEFAAWIINVLRNPGIRPNIKFTIENDGVVIKTFSTGDILEGGAADWKKYGTIFTTPANIGTITLKMTNVNPGGTGNDLAIDDISFRACGPTITPTAANVSSFGNNTAIICAGETKNVELGVTLSAGYNAPQFQWQERSGNNWVNSTKPGAQTNKLTVDFVNAQLGTYIYQLLVAESGNVNSPNCRVISPTISINVIQPPNPVASIANSGRACVGDDTQLFVNEGVRFTWTGPNGFTSTEQNPRLTNITLASAGTYTVTAFNSGGCGKTSSTDLQILPLVIANISPATAAICPQDQVLLTASGGTSYSWAPATGLSNPSIADPIASPEKTTTYTVTISNGICSTTKTVTVTVLKKVVADAGNDLKMIKGQSIALNGRADGENLSYSWSPATALDDATKLNPIASPVADITYTLTVISACGTATDEVFVKVYPKVTIPNAFTPNGDGINDTWNILALGSYPKSKLRVVNRYGQLLFESNSLPWDGKSKGKEVPTGTYYYTLYLDENQKVYSGWVLLTR